MVTSYGPVQADGAIGKGKRICSHVARLSIVSQNTGHYLLQDCRWLIRGVIRYVSVGEEAEAVEESQRKEVKRMIRMRRLVSIVVALALLIAMVPMVAFAADEGQSGGSFTTSNVAPTSVSVALWTTGGTPVETTAMDPQVEYNVKVTVTDSNTLDDLNTVTVTLYYDADGTYNAGDRPGVGNTQTSAILTWTNADPDTWEIDAISDGGSWSIVSGSCVVPSMTASTGTFEFHFIPGKVAQETPGTNEWHIYAVADDGTATGDAYQEDRNMNWYGEITGVTATVSFGTVALGSSDTISTSGVSATYIANGAYNEQVKSDAAWVGQTTGTNLSLDTGGAPGSGEFSLEADDDNTLADAVQVLSASYTAIDGTGTITAEAGDTQANNYLWLSLGSSGILDEEYQGAIYYKIADGS